MKTIRVFLVLVMSVLVLTISVDLSARRGGSIGGFSKPSGGGGSRSFSGSGGGYSPHYGGSSFGGFPIFYAMGGGGTPIAILVVVAFFILKAVVKRKKYSKSGYEQVEDEEGNLFVVQAGYYYGQGELEKQAVKMGEAIDTSNNAGLVRLLREISLELNRNPDSLRWYNFQKIESNNYAQLEGQFRSTVNQERMKLDKEEFTDIDGMQVKRKENFEAGLEEIIVFDLIVATNTNLMLDKKNTVNVQNLNRLMQFFSGLSESNILGVNVTWNILDKDDLLELFPELRSV